MRLRLRWLVLLAFIAVCVARGSWWSVWKQVADQLANGSPDESYIISHTYLLERSRWLEFPLPPASQLAWVLTNANFHPEPPQSEMVAERPGAVYSLDYQIIDSNRDVLEAGSYHFRSKQPDLTKPVAARAFYSDERLVPAAGQSMRLRLTRPFGQACRLRLRQADLDAAIGDVSVRVYYEEEVPDYRLTHAWQRTSKRKREHLCRASVYGSDLLTDNEKHNLLKRRWRPLASLGVEGRDYRGRVLYSPAKDSPYPEGPCELPAGLLVNRWTRAVVPLPTGEGIVRLELTRAPDAEPGDVTICWHGRRNEEIKQWHTILSAPQKEIEFESGDGMLAITSAQELVVSAYWRSLEPTDTEFVDITPHLSAVRAYVVNPKSPVEYVIEHIEQLSTPLKLSVRTLLPLDRSLEINSGRPSPPRVIAWSFVTADGELVAGGDLDVEQVVSQYDRPTSGHVPMQVTDPEVYYYSVPPGVHRMRLESAHGDWLVSACSRPPDVANVTFVPEDYSAFERKEGGRRRWFELRPAEYIRRINESRSVAILVQPRPADVDQQLVAGCFEWQSFQPRGSWNARYLLVPRSAERNIRWESLRSAYYPVATGVEQELTFRTVPGHRSVIPRLVCQSETDKVLPLRVFVNGHLHQEVRVHSGLTDVALNALPIQAGQSTRFRLASTGNVLVLMSHIVAPSTAVFFKRMVTRFEGKTLNFDYDKKNHDEELLALTLFHTASGQRARLRVRIIGHVHRDVGPHLDWTLRDRVYEVEPLETVSAFLFAVSGARVFEQQPCFVRLGSDLPPGSYTIQVSREDNHEGYVLLSRTTPGLNERRSLATETQPTVQIQTEQIGARNGW